MLEIALVVVGLGVIVCSYVISEKVEAALNKNSDISQGRDIWTEKDEKRVRERIDSIVVESVEQAIEKTEYELSRISNEKIMYSNEFSEQVLAKIQKNHEEVVFLYNMLGEKEKQMKSLMQEIESLKTVAEDVVQQEEATTQLKMEDKKSEVELTTTDEKELSQLREFAKFIEEEQLEPKRSSALDLVDTQADENYEDVELNNLDDMDRNDRILVLYRQGMSVLDISKKLDMGQGEVKLIIDLFQGAK